MQTFLEKFENAHSNIDKIIKGGQVKDYLKNLTGLKDRYSFGPMNSMFFSNNLINALIDSQMDKNIDMENLLKLSLGGQFGKKDNWDWSLSGGKGQGQFRFGKNF